MHLTFWWRCDLLSLPKQLSQASYAFAFQSTNLPLFISFSFMFYFSISNLLRGLDDNPILNYFSLTYWSFVKWFDWKTKEASMNDSVWRCDLTEHKVLIWGLQYRMLGITDCQVVRIFSIFTKLLCQQMHSLLKYKMLHLHLKCLFIWLLHVSFRSDHHQGAYDRTLLKLQFL
jgi:hypothetical protein